MIIWSRWGILVLLFLGVGILIGFTIGGVTGLSAASLPIHTMLVGFGILVGAALLWLFNRFVVGTYIDKPRAAVMYEQLAEPVRDENGTLRTHRVLPVLHPETGQQVMTNPVSTLFFVPMKYWSFVFGVIGVLLLVLGPITAAIR